MRDTGQAAGKAGQDRHIAASGNITDNSLSLSLFFFFF
jgi:hypothetical protein